MNNVVLIGRPTKDTEFRYTSGTGNSRSSFKLTVDKGISKSKKQKLKVKDRLLQILL